MRGHLNSSESRDYTSSSAVADKPVRRAALQQTKKFLKTFTLTHIQTHMQ